MFGFNKLSYARRNQVVVAIGILLALSAYGIAIRPTVVLWRQQTELREQTQVVKQFQQQVRQTREKRRQYDSLLLAFSSDTLRQDDYVFNELTRNCRQHGATLSSLTPVNQDDYQGYQIETRIAKLRGPFAALLKVVYNLEYHHPIGRLSSVRWTMEVDRKQRQEHLYAYLYLQNLTGPALHALR